MDTPKLNKAGAKSGKPAPAAPTLPPAPIKVPPLFRKIDWLVLVICFAVVWIAYLFTLAPDLTLEDSGELCTASFYAGIPHPPGYPFWSIYSYLWTLLPFGSVTWRVEVGESCAAAMACGLVGFMVSRGSSMLIDGIKELNEGINRKWENAICVVCGITAGLLLGFDDFMWKESVVINRISLFDVPWLMVVAVCLMRWIYAPQQRRYLYIGMFFFGLCATIHQTMLVAAMGIEVTIALTSPRLGRDMFLGNSFCYILGLLGMASGKLPFMTDLDPMFLAIFHAVGLGSIAACIWLSTKTKGLGTDLKIVILAGVFWFLGAAFYFYEPLSGMTDPPMQWGYPRTVEGFFHALSRGQYEKGHPTDIVHDPMRFINQLGLLIGGLGNSFSWVYLFMALLPFFFLFKMQKRERSWIIGLAAIYFCVGIVLTIVMNTTPDKQAREENKVFFTASHAIVAILIGYGLALLAAYMATHYGRFRRWGFWGAMAAIGLGIFDLWETTGHLFFGPDGQINLFSLPHWVAQAFAPHQYGLPVYGSLMLIAIPLLFIAALWIYRQRAPMGITLILLLFMPVYSGLSHWANGEQRHHWFGYWFGHDMFTPPFVGPDGKFSYDSKLREQILKGPDGDMVYPEMARNTILFGGTDPGRFCPTYMIFCESFVPASCKPMDPVFDRRDVYLITQNALADGTYLDYLRAQYFRSAQIDPPFFKEFLADYWWGFFGLAALLCVIWIGVDFLQNNPQRNRSAIIIGSVWGIILIVVFTAGSRGNNFGGKVSEASYKILDQPLTKFGAHVEAKRRAEGVYPPKEIYIPSPEDSEKAFRDYTDDVQVRAQEGRLQPGEQVSAPDQYGRVSVSGQVAVMMINGLLCKVIFDHNPSNEFYVEESFPLEWMYPYETPFGIIMKINREPLVSLPESDLKRDHEFWSHYSERFIGNWITYDTTVADITNFADKVYLRHDYSNFKGDLKFLRDEDAQKAFSKLRDSQAGMYAWRLRLLIPNLPTDPQYLAYRPKSDEEIQQLYREADFAFKQSLAFCPYSPEVVVRYVNFLFQFNRFDDALMVAQTCLQLDPYNDQINDLVNQIKNIQKQIAGQKEAAASTVEQMETEAQQHPDNIQNLLELGSAYYQMQQPDRAIHEFDLALTNPAISYGEAAGLANLYSKMGAPYLDKLETVLQRLTVLSPDHPEAFYDLAAIKAVRGETNESLDNLRIAMELNAKRLKTNPSAPDLAATNRLDARFNALRSLPEFRKIVPSN